MRLSAILGATGVLVVSLLAAASVRAEEGHFAGCSLSLESAERLDADSVSKGIGIFAQELSFSTGDKHKDKMLGRALVRISQLFGEQPGFGFIEDGRNPNAYASKDSKVPGTWGTVRFGRALFSDLMRRFDDDGIAILAVVAHEFGHIAQYHRGAMETLNAGQKTVKRSELHADLLAGYFLGTRKIANGSLRLRTAGLALYEIGDFSFNSREHHGTPKERVEAAEYGYKLANDGLPFDAAFKSGINWIIERHAS